ncbi:MAG: hypothetical protein ACR2QO_19260 [Acidimicrobiales bacterium]
MNSMNTAEQPHRTGALSRGRRGDVCLSTAHLSADAVTHVADREATATVYVANGAIDASGAEQWMTSTPKFGPFYHFQRWRFAP